MARVIYIVNATQVVTSENHPEGVFSVIPDYPKYIDSRNYPATDGNLNSSEELALIVARADFADRVKQLSLSGNRAMWTVTLERSDGRMIDSKKYGDFPAEPTPEEPEVVE